MKALEDVCRALLSWKDDIQSHAPDITAAISEELVKEPNLQQLMTGVYAAMPIGK